MIPFSQFSEVELKVGTIMAAERVPDSEKLIKLAVDLGEKSGVGLPVFRQIVAGIGKAYEPEQLIGRQIAVVANLEPRVLMGLESQGMLLAASVDGAPVLLAPDAPVPPGTIIR